MPSGTQQRNPEAARRRKTILSVLAASAAVHALVGLGAGIWIVARYFAPPQAVFEAKKMASLPPKIIDPRMAGAEFEAAASKPALNESLASLRETEFALPDLPPMPVGQMAEFDPAAAVSDSLAGMLGGLGSGSGGGGAGGGGNGEGIGISFMGISSAGRSVIILFDISSSVANKAAKAGVPVETIKQEALKMIEGLSINTTFNLFQFSRIYQPFADTLLAPTEANRAAAKGWLEKEFRTDGSLPRGVRNAKSPAAGEDNGICFVLKGALALKPDVVYLISDGSFQSERNSSQVPWKEVEDVVKEHGGMARIHFIGFEMKPEDKKEMKAIVRKTDGTLKEIGKD
jgi:hypothetical protein